LPEAYVDEDFNSLGIIYKQKEGKYIKPYEYFIAMRNKELGLQPETTDDADDSEEEGLNPNHDEDNT
jgi:hypothetical protein